MDASAKYIITAPFCHWIQERNITVSALLSYATRTTHIARGNIQKAIKDTPLEEIPQKKIAKQECYTEIIPATITDLSDICDLSKEHGMHAEKINGMIEFMCDKGVKSGFKTLTKETTYSDFITAGNDTETMNLARDIANTKMTGGEFIKQWRNKHDDEIRARNKSKQRELLEKWWGEYVTPSRDPKDPETSSTISMGYNTTQTSTYQKELQITEYEPNISEIATEPRTMITQHGADVPKEIFDNIPTFDGKSGVLNQFLNTIESYSTMYRICKTDLVMLRSREKVYEIIQHVLQEDAKVV